MSEYSTGELRATITSEKDVTIDQVVAEADSILRESRSRKIKTGDVASAEELMSEMRKKHPEFCKSYPIVLRYICQMHDSSKAFRTYLIKIKERPWKTQEEYLDSQADYVVILYKATHRRWNATQCENIRKNVRMMLQNEHDTFVKYAKEFDREVNEEEGELKKRTEEEMRKFYAEYGTETLEVPIVTKTDITTDGIVDIDSLPSPDVEVTSISADSLLGDL